MRKVVALLILSTSILFTSCRKNKPVPPAPEKALLRFPDKNSACISGTVISETQSTIAFSWSPSANASSYEIFIKNLLTGQTASHASTTNEINLSIARNTPFSWYVISKSDKNASAAQSEVWKFYNSGISTVSHPPFPADALAPAQGGVVSSTPNTINLSWAGADADNDIATYDIYFSTNSTPAIFKTNIANAFLNDLQITSGTTYYWKIVSKDSKGNSSESAVFQFRVN